MLRELFVSAAVGLLAAFLGWIYLSQPAEVQRRAKRPPLGRRQTA